MIRQIATQAVYVEDQAAAEEFWVNKLGFAVVAKHPMGNGLFWLELAPPGRESRIVLYPRALMKDWEMRRPSLVFECDDLEVTLAELRSLGVRTGPPPQKMEWGSFSSFQDPDGNEFILRA